MGTLLFSHFWVTKVELVNEKSSLNITVSKRNGLRNSIKFFVFGLFCVGKYVMSIWVC